ncbi:achelase-1-like isoform X2 [Choristoneura fumiferana]|uniref:achelase-1-like isoform X2 n=1 Tax=Choristoneura fumiferana TaxID=7141 RepID=UPI003D155B6D
MFLTRSNAATAEQYNLTVVQLPAEAPAPEAPAEGAAPGSRIIGGTPAAIESYPYAVQILASNQLSCGGSLVTRRHVLSAAHCFVDSRGVLYSTSLFTIRVGTAQLNSGGTTRRVSRIVNHERYNVGWARDNDISVVVLASTVTLSARVALAFLPAQGNQVPDNAPVIAVGWGRTNAGVNQASPVLNQVAVYTVNLNTCAARYRQLEYIKNEPFPVTTNMICSGLLDVGGRDACQGDSGGPVIYAGVVVGVTSWGEGCALPTYPGVNARVSAYTNWINSTITRFNGAPSLSHASVCLLLLSVIVPSLFSNKL